jgi:hypothetical protein
VIQLELPPARQLEAWRNGVKYTHEGGVTIRLGTRKNAPDHLLIEVEDTGPGISAEDQKLLFSPFITLTKDVSQGGTGLGLTISRHFIELMGGTISVGSFAGKGSTFRIDLKFEPSTEEEISALRHRLPKGEVTGLAPGTPCFKILIAEEQQQEMLAAGMNGFVRKPYRFHEIYDTMAKQLEVEYVYADTEVEEQSPAALIPNDFSALLVFLREELLRALENLDAESINRLIEQIGEHDKNLSQTLTRYTENYDYPPIIAALRELLRHN